MSSNILLESSATIQSYKVKLGEFVSPGSILLIYQQDNVEFTKKLKAEKFGNVNDIKFKNGDKVKAG